MTIHLRPATDGDRELLVQIFASTRAELLAQLPLPYEQKLAFVAQQFAAQDAQYRRCYPDASFEVVIVEDRAAGRLYVQRRSAEIHLIDISLLPQFRGRGLGTQLLQALCRQAAAANKKVTLNVDPWSRARRLYRRLGFEEVDAGDAIVKMEWTTDRAPDGPSVNEGRTRRLAFPERLD